MKKYLFLLPLSAFLFISFSTSALQKPRKGKDYAVFFAVNNYQSTKITALQNPINDAKLIAEHLRSMYDFDTKVVENPTYDIIRSTLNAYRDSFRTNRFDNDGQLLVFFSGHGRNEANVGYFLPADVNPDDIERSAFSYNNWRGKIDNISCKHILVAIDACYSGTFDPQFGMRSDGLFGTRAGELSEGERLVVEHNKHKTRLFFTSGETDQPTPDKSDFAKKIIAALLTKGYDDGVLTSSEIFSNHLEKAAPRPRTGEFGNDEAGSSFLFISKELPAKVQPMTDEEATTTIPPMYINFDLNQEKITGKEVVRLAPKIARNPSTRWVVKGFSSVNDEELAFTRAKNVIEVLVLKLGVDRSRLILMYEKYKDNTTLYGLDRVEIRVALFDDDKEMSGPVKETPDVSENNRTGSFQDEIKEAIATVNLSVKNERGVPLDLFSIYEKKSLTKKLESIGMTNKEGKKTIQIQKGNALVFQKDRYKQQVVVISNDTTLNIRMFPLPTKKAPSKD